MPSSGASASWFRTGTSTAPSIGTRRCAAARRRTLNPVDLTNDDTAFLQYTGGTTGVAKGAVLTHRNILANLEQTGVWLSGNFREGAEIVIAPLPMYHIFCLTSTLLFMKWGSLIVLITNPRDLPAFVKEMRKWQWTVMTGVNTLFNGLMNTRRIRAGQFRDGQAGGRWGRRRAESGGGAMDAVDGHVHHRGIRSHRNVAGRLRESAGGSLVRQDRTCHSLLRTSPSVTSISMRCRRGQAATMSSATPAKSASAGRK